MLLAAVYLQRATGWQPARRAPVWTLLLVLGGMAFAQDLKIDFQVNVAADDPANYFTFAGPIRYMAVTKDTLDATTGASKQGSTHLFQPYLLDVKGKNTLPSGLRGLFLFAVAAKTQRPDDNLTVTKASDGTITVQPGNINLQVNSSPVTPVFSSSGGITS